MLYNKEIFKRCFCYKGKYFIRNFKYIPLYFRLIRYLMKHGYDEYATWETYDWFIKVMRQILKNYKENRNGTPIVIEGYPMYSSPQTDDDKRKVEQNEEKWDGILDEMIDLLNSMDECNPIYESKKYAGDYKKINNDMNKAKDKFFELFSKYFYNLWD